jgi:redox-sensitive bicupin YhaK (pirin superfamily)
VNAGELAVLGQGTGVRLTGEAKGSESRGLLVAGRPLHEPVARYGPFVMNTREQLMQAVEDYQKGKF